MGSRHFDLSALPERLQQKLLNQESLGLKRELRGRKGIDFSSNDYLGLAQTLVSEDLNWNDQTLSTGSTASRLLRGQHPIFEELEVELAKFSGTQAALFFPTGYQCNLSVVSALAGPEDLIYSDSLNHASLIDGIKLSGAQKKVFPHGDFKYLTETLELDQDYPGEKWIITESLFSMDGNFGPLTALSELAKRFKARLIVDEAHATGLYGTRGSGWVEKLGIRDQVFGSVHAAGKTLGVGGAWFACSREVKDYLINFSRGFIFSTAPIPAQAALVLRSLGLWKKTGLARVDQLLKKIVLFKDKMGIEDDLPCPIIPIILGENDLTVRVAQGLQEAGFDVRAIRPPTVPIGTARLRITLHSHNTDREVLALADAVLAASKTYSK